jgi:hypothetical protein
MTARPLPLSHLVLALTGPIVWAAHFFILYLAEAFTCTSAGIAHDAVRWIGAGATAAALAILAVWSMRFSKTARGSVGGLSQPEVRFAFAVPLALLSAIAILWSAMPLVLLPVCTQGTG